MRAKPARLIKFAEDENGLESALKVDLNLQFYFSEEKKKQTIKVFSKNMKLNQDVLKS